MLKLKLFESNGFDIECYSRCISHWQLITYWILIFSISVVHNISDLRHNDDPIVKRGTRLLQYRYLSGVSAFSLWWCVGVISCSCCCPFSDEGSCCSVSKARVRVRYYWYQYYLDIVFIKIMEITFKNIILWLTVLYIVWK